MQYVNVFVTRSDADFQFAVNLLRKNGIRIETVNEFILAPDYVFEDYTYAGSIEGAIIRVPKEKYVHANHLLLENGLKEQIDLDKTEFSFVKKLKEITAKIPYLNQLSPYRQVVIGMASAVAIPFLCIVLFFGNNHKKSRGFNHTRVPFIGYTWCVRKINYLGKPKEIKTLQAKVDNYCLGEVFFRRDQTVSLPGIQSLVTEAQWALVDSVAPKIRIYNSNRHPHVYNGTYEVIQKPEKERVILKSEKTVIAVQVERLYYLGR